MLRFKSSVSIRALEPQLLVALLLAEQVYAAEGIECVVTSGDDPGHKPGSLHDVGLALDLRSKHVHPASKPRVVAALRETLVPLGFEVLFEYPGEEREHVHVEFDPDHLNR